MKRKAFGVALIGALILGSIGIYHAESENITYEKEYNVVEVVSDEKYQEFAYFFSGYEPVNIADLEDDTDNLTQNLTILKSLGLSGSKDTTYTEINSDTDTDLTSSEKFEQLGYFTYSSDGKGEYEAISLKSLQVDVKDMINKYAVYSYSTKGYTKVSSDTIAKTELGIATKNWYFYIKTGSIDSYYSYNDIMSLSEEYKDYDYILGFEKKSGGNWTFTPAYIGRHYTINDENLFEYSSQNKSDDYSKWFALSNKRYFSVDDESTSQIRGSISVKESTNKADTVISATIVNKNLLDSDLTDVLGTSNYKVNFQVVKYSSLTESIVKNTDLLYFNTNGIASTDDTKVSEIYKNYNKKYKEPDSYDNYKSISATVSMLIIDRMYENELNVIFDSGANNIVKQNEGNLCNFEKLYVLCNTTYPAIIKNGEINDWGDTLYNTIFSGVYTRSNLFSNVPVAIDNNVDEYAKFNINNMSLADSYVVGHSVLSGVDLLSDYNINVVSFIQGSTSSLFDYYDASESAQISGGRALSFMLKQQETSELADTVRILEIEPNASYLSQTYWNWRMYGIDPFFTGTVKVSQMTSREFICRTEDLLGTYDIIYVGSKYDNDTTSSIDKNYSGISFTVTDNTVTSLEYENNRTISLSKNDKVTYNITDFVKSDSQVVISGATNINTYTDSTFTIVGDESKSCSVKFKVNNIEYTLSINVLVSGINDDSIITLNNKDYLTKEIELSWKTKRKIKFELSKGKLNQKSSSSSTRYVDISLINKEGVEIKLGKVGGTVTAYAGILNSDDSFTITKDKLFEVNNSSTTNYITETYLVSDLNNANIIRVYFTGDCISDTDDKLNSRDETKIKVLELISKITSADIDLNASVSLGKGSSYNFSTILNSLGIWNWYYESINLDIDFGNNSIITDYDKYNHILSCSYNGTDAGTFSAKYELYGINWDKSTTNLCTGTITLTVYSDSEWKSIVGGFNTVFNDSAMNGKLYFKLGDVYYNYSTTSSKSIFGGITSLNWGTSQDGSKTRGSGNDITSKKYNAIKEFMNSGRLVLLSSAFYNSDNTLNKAKFDITSNVYKLAQLDKIVKDSGTLNYDFSYIDDDTFTVTFSEIPQIYMDSTKVSSIELPDFIASNCVGSTAIADCDNPYYLNGKNNSYRTLTYKFKINTNTKSTENYTVSLYSDLISDGVFTDEEILSGIVIKDESGNTVSSSKLSAGKTYTLTRELDSDIVGCVHWQLQFVRNDNDSVRNSFDYYTALLPVETNEGTSNKQTLNILQILPVNRQDDDGTGDKTSSDYKNKYVTFNMETNTQFNTYLKNVSEFDIAIKSLRYTQLVDEDGNFIDIEVTSLGGRTETLTMVDFDMLVLGFGDSNTYINAGTDKQNEVVITAIQEFINSGKSVLMTHDSISYNNSDSSNSSLYSFYETRYLRNLIGQDRYGTSLYDALTYSKVKSKDYSEYYIYNSNLSFAERVKSAGKDTVSSYADGSLTKSYSDSSGSSNMLVGVVEGLNQYLINTNSDSGWISKHTTTQVSKVNTGQINYYPYYIPDTLTVAQTHNQYYQLDMEADNINVWYTLDDVLDDYYSDYNDKAKYKDKDSKNGRDLYYIYNKGNVTYTGVGHNVVAGDDEMKLFVNTLVMAYRTSGRTPDLEVTNTNAQNTKDATYIYLDTDISNETKKYDDSGKVIHDIYAEYYDENTNTIRVHFKASDTSVAYLKKDYISFGGIGVSSVYTDEGVEIEPEKEGTTQGYYKLPSSGEFYVDCDIQSMLGIDEDITDSFQLKFTCKLYTSYGLKQQSDTSEKTVYLIKRGLFDIH